MGLFEEHLEETVEIYPPLSIAIVAVLFAATGDGTAVLWTLVIGSILLKAGLVLPDIDSHSSKPRRMAGRVVTSALVVATVFVAAGEIVPWRITVDLPGPGMMAVSTSLAFVLWSGIASRHRNLTHSIVWCTTVALLVGVLTASVTATESRRLGALLGGAMAVYSFVGIYRHQRLDEILRILWDWSPKPYECHEPYIAATKSYYPRLSLLMVAVGVVFVDASVVLLLLLSSGSLLLAIGATLPHIDRKRSEPRRLFDRVVTIGIGAVAGYWTLAALRIVPATPPNAVPPDAVLPVALLGLVLWTGRDADQDTVTHTPAWAAAIAVGAAVVAYVFASWLPASESMVVALGVGSYLAAGTFLHFRREGVPWR